MKIHLVDGTYELFRAYFGARPVVAQDGTDVGATLGLIRSLLALVNREGATHIAVAFDTVIESFRNEMFHGYKTGEGIEPELKLQFPLAERATAALGMTVWSMIEFEADDALAAGAAKYADDDRVSQVILCTPDKDMAQCVTRDDRIVYSDRMRGVTRGFEQVIEKFGVEPQSIPDYLGLVGDTADGIPGLARWGAKSSATVLAHYRHIEDIPDDDGAWPFKVRGAASLAKVLREQRDEALLFRDLAVLRRDVPLAESIEDLEWHGVDRDKLSRFIAELGVGFDINTAKKFRD